jgi:CARDB protein
MGPRKQSNRPASRMEARQRCGLSLEPLEPRLLLDSQLLPPATCPSPEGYLDMDPAGDFHHSSTIGIANDVDTFWFSPDATTNPATFSGTTPSSDLDIRLALYDSSLNSTGDFNDDLSLTDKDSYFEANVTVGSGYVLRVDGFVASQGSYDILINTATPTIVDLGVDGNGMGSSSGTGVSFVGDHDFWRVTAPVGMNYLHLWTTGSTRTKLTLYSYDGANYTALFQNGSSPNADMGVPVTPGQDYYIALTGVNNATGATTVNVDFDPRPDLMGTYFNSDEPVLWGQSFNVTAGVWNGGTWWSGWATAEFYLSNDTNFGDADDIFLGWTGIDPLAPYGWVMPTVSLTMPGGPDTGYDMTNDVFIGMILDRGDLVTEANEGNNRNLGDGLDWDRAQQSKADLVGTLFDSDEPLYWGQTFTVDAGIWNGGTQWSGWAPVEFYLSSDTTFGDADDVFLGWQGINPLAPYDWTLITDKALTLPGAAPVGYGGTFYVGMIIDRADLVDELSEANNTNQGDGLDQDEVSTFLPDLYGTHFDSGEPLHWGETFAVNVGVYNGGTGWSGWTAVDFYMSSNATVSNGDEWLGWASVPALAPGGWTTIWGHSLTLPGAAPGGFTTPDDVYIGMIIDMNGLVTELNELNNRNEGNGLDRDVVQILAGAPAPAPSTAPAETVDALAGVLTKSAMGGIGLTAANLTLPGERVFELLAEQTLLGAYDRSALQVTDLDQLFSFGDGLGLSV